MCISGTFIPLFISCFRPGGRPKYVVIKGAAKGSNITDDDTEEQLENSFNESAEIIVIEPPALGNEVSRWITVGNLIHKTSVISGILCCGFQHFDNSRKYLIFTFGAISSVCAIAYATFWVHDPCSKYQVAEHVPELEHIIGNLNSATPVVLVRKNDHRRKVLHNTIGLVSGVICATKIAQWIKS